MSNKRYFCIPLILLVGLFTIYLISKTKPESKTETVIGFISTGKATDEGWNKNNFDGIKSASKKLRTKLILKDEVEENSGKCPKAVEELINAGANLIILSSYSYASETIELIKKNPEISFYANFVPEQIRNLENISSYFVRMYQGRYLAGIVAGMKTKTERIGYVCAKKTNEVFRGLNAFALGVQSVNPQAKVYAIWTDSWDNEEVEKAAVKKLYDSASIDIITYHQNKSHVYEAAKALGIKTIGYHTAFSDSKLALTSVICLWEKTYEEIQKQFLQGKANKKQNYWLGIEDGVVGLSKFSVDVEPNIWKKVEEVREKMLAGWDVFSGEIIDNNGVVRCKKDEVLSDDLILEKMDWIVKNVETIEN